VTVALARAVAAALLWAALPAAASAQPAPVTRSDTAPELVAEVEEPAPVLVGGQPIVIVPTGAGGYTPAMRAERIAERIGQAIAAPGPDPAMSVVEVDGASEIRAGARLLMVVTAQDARRLGAARASLAKEYATLLEAAIRDERAQRTPSALMVSGSYGLAATAAFAFGLWVMIRLTRSMRRTIAGWRDARLGVRLRGAEIVGGDRIGRVFDRGVTVFLAVGVLVLIDLYLTYLLGLFPWTRPASRTLLNYIVSPIRFIGEGFVGYLPKLMFVIVIALTTRGLVRLVNLLFTQVKQGRIVFQNFPVEWADPTAKIAKLLLIVFGLIVAFPYLPASDSAAFTGVSVFMGVLLSLSSSSAVSNAIAGVVLTYTRAFSIGDRVKIGDHFGDITETSMLVTRVRTIKNEDITIPNNLVLNGAMVNYSRQAGRLGLILHTAVTIGYDAPWRQVHELLIRAALATPSILPEPRPFVWQTALNDFYVTYEINAHTRNAADMVTTYALLHANIQDVFAEAGVEIMSPHYTSVRDGGAVAIPAARRPPGYRAPAIRIDYAAEPVPGSRS
jgi:small-conductance mechanosensitive channel